MMYYINCSKKGGASSKAVQVAPVEPEVESASILDDDEDKRAKLSGGKGSLKIPLSDTSTTGLKV